MGFKLLGFKIIPHFKASTLLHLSAVFTLATIMAYTETAKSVSLSIQIEEPGGDGSFSEPAIGKVINTVSSRDYSSTNTGYTKLASGMKVTVKPGETAPFRVTGTANPKAAWAEGDQINVVPVFKVNANLKDI